VKAGTSTTSCAGVGRIGQRLGLAASRMIFSPSRSHCTTAPAMKIDPSSA
jgi:hypothetical protein